ncbi:hypothetical protein C5167_036054 [Papaver somniferum]|uniref:transcription factor bHLH30-like n=1 Tax=Papaver somniferum TaxID=3469 RepID=UPI000E6F6AA8|nr:transcription factor bHLH30-like [Papaver somniferum]XP_026433740.1 transcription factor bHLH30-like [Papaver somniferum]RZC87514.1 hypothetical protein C5167_036054 [Papaver somniferum]
MCGKKEEDESGECSHQSSIHEQHGYHQQQLFLQQQQQQQLHQQQFTCSNDAYDGGGGRGGGGQVFPSDMISPILPWSLPPVHAAFNPVQFSTVQNHHPADHPLNLVSHTNPPPPLPTSSASSYGALFNNRRASSYNHLHFAPSYDHHPSSSSSDQHHHHLRIISDQLIGSFHHHHNQPTSSSHHLHPFGNSSIQAELGKMTAQEILDAKALAASKSHSEAERRRRERINNHLAKLRSLLPSTTKTDKASLLAEVIQHVKELKRQTSQIAEASPVPTENDELTVDNASDEDGRFIIKASLCCEDRSDLLPDLIKTLKALRLRTLKAEITTLGGRVKNVLFITGDDDHDHNEDDDSHDHHHQQQQHSLSSIQEALKAVMERSTTTNATLPGGGGDDSSSGTIKRQRTTTGSTTSNMNMLENRSL